MAYMSGSPVLTQDRWAGERGVAGARPMTVGGTMLATGVLLVLLIAGGVVGWMSATQPAPVTLPSGETVVQNISWPPWIFIAGLVGLGLALVVSFKPKLAPFLSPLYALAYGTVVGAISAIYEYQFDGIVLQAVMATIGVSLGMLFLYVTRIIKVTNRFVMVVAGATFGIFLMYMAAWLLSIFGVDIAFWNDPTPLGIAISVGIVIIAALNLAIDFAFIEGSAQMGAPRYMEWYGAFGVVVTLVWLYLEVLRLLALLRGDR